MGSFGWYNGEHRHSGIGLLTPETVHYGKAELVTNQRGLVLAEAFNAHPERFVRGRPQAAWINKPKATLDGSKVSLIVENDPITEVSGHGSSGDRRSSDFLFSDLVLEVTVNDTKFDEPVSQTG